MSAVLMMGLLKFGIAIALKGNSPLIGMSGRFFAFICLVGYRNNHNLLLCELIKGMKFSSKE